jgi:hypothetical protein
VLLFTAVKDGTLPLPDALNPILVFELVHAKVAPEGLLRNPFKGTDAPLQYVRFGSKPLKPGCGFTVMVKVEGVPGQVPEKGVTVIVAVIGEVVLFVAVNEGILPEPLAPRPIAVFEFVQVYVAPVVVLVKFIAATVPLLHAVMFAGWVTKANGFTVIVYVVGVPTQPLAVGVTVIVPESGLAVVLVAVKEAMFPVPLAASPIAGCSGYIAEKVACAHCSIFTYNNICYRCNCWFRIDSYQCSCC